MARKLRKLKKKDKQSKKKNNRKKPVPSTPSDTTSSRESSIVISEKGKMIFSKFDFFGDETAAPNAKQIAGKNLTHLLNKTEAEKRRLEQLAETDPQKAKSLVEKKAWQEAVLKAQGVKLKNDPTKLKHALKNQEKRKLKSKKAWDARKQSVGKQKREKQDKREKNLDSRKKAVMDKKRKKHVKKGHIIPGFN